jgi:hypothetical protein
MYLSFYNKPCEHIVDCGVYYKNKKILDSRDREYHTKGGW